MNTQVVPRNIVFMTDEDIDKLVAYFKEEELISHETLLSEYKMTPERIKSLVYSNLLDQVGEGRDSSYRAGKLWYSVRTNYRYGSKSNSDLAEDLKFLSWRMKEDWERAFLFHPGDVVGRTWAGDTPGKKGVVVGVMPTMRKVMVRWPYGTEQEDASTLQLIVRDNGSRQIDVPTIDKDILDEYPYNDFTFDQDSYKLQKDQYKRWSIRPSVDDEGNPKKKSNKKASIDNIKFTGSLSKLEMSDDRLKKIAAVLTNDSGNLEDLNAEYLLTQAEIIVSVNTEKDNPMYKDTPWYITEDTSCNVNDNGDCWTTPTIANTYNSFRGAYNFYEHDQRIEASKGRVIDAVLRKVPLSGDNFYYAVELLVATNRKHKDLVRRIESGDLNTLSMGCSATYTICSQCGNISYSPDTKCDHLAFRKGGYFFDQYGVKRVIAEICGSELHPDSVEFEEASFVEVPAWRKAEVHNIIANKTNLINVVGYLSTRLYNKNSVELLLTDGNVEEIDLDFKKVVANTEYDDNKDESELLSLDSSMSVQAADDEFDLGAGDEGVDFEDTGSSSEPADEDYEIELGEFYDEPVKYEGLLEDNILE